MSSSAEVRRRMSSRSIGVTNVWLTRRDHLVRQLIAVPLAYQDVPREPPTLWEPGEHLAEQLRRPRTTFAPARANKSKNSRSLPRRDWLDRKHHAQRQPREMSNDLCKSHGRHSTRAGSTLRAPTASRRSLLRGAAALTD